MNDNLNRTEIEQPVDTSPKNTAKLKSFAKKSDRVFVYSAKNDSDEENENTVV